MDKLRSEKSWSVSTKQNAMLGYEFKVREDTLSIAKCEKGKNKACQVIVKVNTIQ